jgi:predicted nuclease with RNAse H fold
VLLAQSKGARQPPLQREKQKLQLRYILSVTITMVISNRTLRREEQLQKAVEVYKTHPDYSSIQKTAACFELVSASTLGDRLKHGRNKVADIAARSVLSGR